MNNTDFMMLYEKYRGFSRKLIQRVVSDKRDIDEICQEAFRNIYKMGEELDLSNERMIYGLVKTVTLNEMRDYCRKASRKYECLSSDSEYEQTIRDLSYEIDDVIFAREAERGIRLIFLRLRDTQERNYEIYTRIKFYGIPPAFVAEQFHTTTNNINNIVMRTKNWLKDEYSKM